MKNDTDKEVVVETHANTAITNSNGITDYSVIDPQLDSTLKIPFSKIAKVKKKQNSCQKYNYIRCKC